jgi:hypothetical protein
MLKKGVHTIASLLSAAARSSTVQAGSTVSDKCYWPSAASHSSEYDLNSAFAYRRAGLAIHFDRSSYQTNGARVRNTLRGSSG